MSDDFDDDLDALAGSDHAPWLAEHREEASAAEEWLAQVLGGRDEPSAPGAPIGESPNATLPGGERDRDVAATIGGADGDWRVETLSGGLLVAHHDQSGAVVSGHLVLGVTDDAIRLRLLEYRYVIPVEFGAPGPPVPVEAIEQFVNEPDTAQSVLDSLAEAPVPGGEVPRLRIPPAMLRGRRRSDDFYRAVAALVRTCREHKIAYGPRLSADNGVSEGTIRSWVHEARRRGLLERMDPKP